MKIFIKCCTVHHLNMACLIVRVSMVKNLSRTYSLYVVTPLKALFSSDDLMMVWLQASDPFSCQLEEQMLLPKKCKDLPCRGPLRCSERYEACGCRVYACLRKFPLPDVVIRCFIFFMFRETVFLQKIGVFAHAKVATAVLLMFVSAVMHLNVGDIVDLMCY